MSLYGNNDLVILENYIFNSKDIEYRFDEFKNGSVKLLFITGHSGSGKSTEAKKIADEMKITNIELDDIWMNYKFTNEQLKEYDQIIFDFFNDNQKYRWKTKQEQIDSKNKFLIHKDFIKYIIKNTKSQYIIEGIEIADCIKEGDISISELKEYAIIIIKGTSVIVSSYRGSNRDASDSKNPDKIFTIIKLFFNCIKHSKDWKTLSIYTKGELKKIESKDKNQRNVMCNECNEILLEQKENKYKELYKDALNIYMHLSLEDRKLISSNHPDNL